MLLAYVTQVEVDNFARAEPERQGSIHRVIQADDQTAPSNECNDTLENLELREQSDY